MRKWIFIVLCLFFSVSFASEKTSVIKIQHWETSKGAKVYFVPVSNLPMIDVRVIFTAGSAYDGKNPGIASLAASLIGEGTAKQSANDVAKTFDNVGARFSTSVDRDRAVLSLRSLIKPEYFKLALREFIHVVADSSFLEKDFQRQKNLAIATIKVGQQRPGNVAKRAFYESVYGKQVYGHDPVGTISSVKQITRDQAFSFYRNYYVAKNAYIILVGDLDKTAAQKVAEKISSQLASGKSAPKLPESVPLHHDIHRHIQFPAKQTAILIGQLGINRQNPDYFPLVVGNYAFGGLPLSSVLFEKVRDENGLAYYAGSYFQALRYRGPFVIQLKTRASKTKEALSVVQEALGNFVKDGVSEEQLSAAKQNLIGSFPLAFSSNASIAGIVSNIAFYHLPLNYLDVYRSKIKAVTADQVKNAFQKTIHLNHLVIITVGPTSFEQ